MKHHAHALKSKLGVTTATASLQVTNWLPGGRTARQALLTSMHSCRNAVIEFDNNPFVDLTEDLKQGCNINYLKPNRLAVTPHCVVRTSLDGCCSSQLEDAVFDSLPGMKTSKKTMLEAVHAAACNAF